MGNFSSTDRNRLPDDAEAIASTTTFPLSDAVCLPFPADSSDVLMSRAEAVKKITGLSLPMALSYTFSFSIVALGVMAGRIGNDEDDQDYLGASALISTMLTTVMLIALSSLYSISISTSNARGQLLRLKEAPVPEEEEASRTQQEGIEAAEKNIARVLKNSFIMALAITPPAFFSLFYSKAILMGFGQREDVSELAQSYLRPYAFAVPGLLLRMCEEQIMFSFEKQLPAMFLGLSSFAIGVFFADVLCFGYLSFPKLGLPGIAYGFIGEAYLTCLVFGIYLAASKTFKEFNFFNNFSFKKEDREQIKNLFTIGWPISATLSMEVTAMLVTSLLAGLLGKDELITWGVGSQFSFFALILLVALGQATCQEVSRALGKSENLNVNRLAKYGLFTNVMLILPLCILVSAYPDILKWIITNDDLSDEIMQMVKILVPIVAAGVAVDSVRYNILQVLRAMGDHVKPTVISIFNTWLGVLMAYILGFHTNLGIYGVAAGFTIGLTTGALALLPRWIAKIKSFEVDQPRTAAGEPTLTTPLLQEVITLNNSDNQRRDSDPLPTNRNKKEFCPPPFDWSCFEICK
jgi:MATE family multidrug resistance protein